MKVKMILPALTEAKSPYFRPIKYSLFPPLGLATLAGYLGEVPPVRRDLIQRRRYLVPNSLVVSRGCPHSCDFYRWGSILRGACAKPELRGRLRHVAYAAGRKKLEPFWDAVIRLRRVSGMLPMLEAVLGSGRAVRSGRRGQVLNRAQRVCEARFNP
jgi:hypothetical protein